MKEILKTIILKEKVNTLMPMETFMKVILLMIAFMEKGVLYMSMGINMLGIGNMI